MLKPHSLHDYLINCSWLRQSGGEGPTSKSWDSGPASTGRRHSTATRCCIVMGPLLMRNSCCLSVNFKIFVTFPQWWGYICNFAFICPFIVRFDFKCRIHDKPVSQECYTCITSLHMTIWNIYSNYRVWRLRAFSCKVAEYLVLKYYCRLFQCVTPTLIPYCWVYEKTAIKFLYFPPCSR